VRNARDFLARIGHRVQRGRSIVRDAARASVIEAAQQLAHDDQSVPRKISGRTGPVRSRPAHARAGLRLAYAPTPRRNASNADLRTVIRRQMIEVRMSDGAKQNRIRPFGRRDSFPREGQAGRRESRLRQ
jgi:hypothetical protein